MKKNACRFYSLIAIVLFITSIKAQSLGGILINPATVCAGNNTGLLTLSSYSGSIVRWEFAYSAGGPWSMMAHSSNSYTFSNLSQTTYFRVVVQLTGFPEAVSNNVAITCIPPSAGGTATAALFQCAASLGTASLSGQTGIIKWQISTDNWVTSSNFNSPTQTFVTLPVISTSASIRALVTNGSCPVAFSNTLIINAVPQTMGGSVAGNSVVCSGVNSYSMAVAGYTGTIQQWESALTLNGPYNGIPNSTGSTILLGNLTQTAYYRVKVQSGNCATEYSNRFEVQANAQSIGGFIIGTSTVCAGINSGSLQLFSNNGTINQWEFSSTNGSSWQNINSNSNVLNFSNLTSSRLYRARVQSGICPAVYSPQFSITTYTIPSASFSTNNACVNSVMQFSNSSTSSTSSLWNFGDNNGSTIFNPGHSYSTVGNHTVTLITTNTLGCSDTVSNVVTSYPRPTASFLSDDTICHGNSLSFYNTSSINSGTITDLLFNFADAAITASLSPAAHAFSAPGNYLVKLTVLSSFGCADSVTSTIKVYPKPSAAFSIKNNCVNDHLNILNTSSLSYGQLFQTWSFGNGDNAIGATPSYSYSTSGNYICALFCKSEHNCADTSFSNVAIHPRHQLSINIPPNNCQSVAVHFNSSFTNSIPVKSSKIYFGDGDSSANMNDMHIYSNPGVYTASAVIVSDSGCVAESKKNLTINLRPNAEFSVANICSNDSVPYQNLSSPKENLNYLWRFSDSSTSNFQSPKHKYLKAGSKKTSLLVITAKGCRDSLEKNHQVYEPPTAGFLSANICQNANQTFTNTGITSNNTLNHYWTFGDGTISTEKFPDKSYSSHGFYNVRLVSTTGEGCSDTATQTVQIYELLKANFSANDVCINETAFFKNNSKRVSSAFESSWSFGDSTFSEQNSPQHDYKVAGKYFVSLVVQGNITCKDSISREIIIRPLPHLIATTDSVIDKGSECILNVSGAQTYSWFPQDFLNNPFNAQPVCTATVSSHFTVVGRDEYGCSAIDSLYVRVLNNYKIHPTNILTPDNNGKNDTWIVGNIEEYPNNKVTIFDAWNEVVFEKENYQNDFSGKNMQDEMLPDGTYYYLISFADNAAKYTGYITLLRQKH